MKYFILCATLILCSCFMVSCNIPDASRIPYDTEQQSGAETKPNDTSSPNNSSQEEFGPVKPDDIASIAQVKTKYFYSGEETDIKAIATILCEELISDLMVKEDGRTFVITDYKDLGVTVLSKEDGEKDEFAAHLRLSDCTWYIIATAEMQFEGTISPIEYNSNHNYEQVHLGNRYLVKGDARYCLIDEETYDYAK